MCRWEGRANVNLGLNFLVFGRNFLSKVHFVPQDLTLALESEDSGRGEG